jgi:two-component sensor histidine kinase
MKLILLFSALCLSTTLYSQDVTRKNFQKNGSANALNDSAVRLWQKNQYDSALLVATTALSLARQNNDTLQSAKCLNTVGLIYSSKGDAIRSIFYYEQSLTELRSINNKNELYTSLLNLGIAYKERAIYDKALKYLFEAEEHFNKVRDDKKLSATYNTIGNIFMLEESYKKALEFHRKALKIRESIGDTRGVASSTNNIGIVFKKIDNYDSALLYLYKALELKEIGGSPEKVANTISHIAEIQSLKGNHTTAEQLFKQAYRIRDSLGNKKGVTHSLYELGYLYYSKNKFSVSEKYLLQGVAKSKEIGASDILLRNFDVLRKLYRKIKNYPKALLYDDLYITLHEELLGEKNKSLLAQMQIKYETAKKQDEIKQLNQDKEKREIILLNQRLKLQTRKEHNRNLTILIILITCISVLLGILYRTKVHFAKTLSVVMREMHHRIKNNFQVLLSLFSLQKAHINDEFLQDMIESNIHRISAMGYIHQELYETKDLTKMKLTTYIYNLVDSLKTAYSPQDKTVKVEYEIDENIEINVDKAISIGLLINELVTNAFKYAFVTANNNPSLFVALKRNHKYELIVKDNGKGFVSENITTKSFGLKLVESQVKKLKGEMTKEYSNGIKYTIVFS